MRIVSLCPSATSLIADLGLQTSLVGISHQCPEPEGLGPLPRVTKTLVAMPPEPGAIDQVVREYAGQDGLYEIDTALLAALEPDIILGQNTCSVCATSDSLIQKAIEGVVPQARLVNVSALSLEDFFTSLNLLGRELKVPDRAKRLAASLQERLARVEQSAAPRPPVTAVAVEWVDPLLAAGAWIKDLLILAGADLLLPPAGSLRGELSWEAVLAADPEVILILPCGFNLVEGVRHAQVLATRPGWSDLRAVRSGRVYLLDGDICTRYDSRIAEVAETFHQILHPGSLPGVIPNLPVQQWNKLDGNEF